MVPPSLCVHAASINIEKHFFLDFWFLSIFFLVGGGGCVRKQIGLLQQFPFRGKIKFTKEMCNSVCYEHGRESNPFRSIFRKSWFHKSAASFKRIIVTWLCSSSCDGPTSQYHPTLLSQLPTRSLKFGPRAAIDKTTLGWMAVSWNCSLLCGGFSCALGITVGRVLSESAQEKPVIHVPRLHTKITFTHLTVISCVFSVFPSENVCKVRDLVIVVNTD